MISLKEKNVINDLEFTVNKYNGWYIDDDFKFQLRKELVRSTRNGLPISQVRIALSNRFRISRYITKDIYDHIHALLIKTINDNTRISDVKILTADKTKIAILLVDTSLDGAKAFIEKFLNKFFIRIQSQLHFGYIDLIDSIVISVYPFESGVINEHDTITSVPLMVNSMELSSASIIDNLGFTSPEKLTKKHTLKSGEKSTFPVKSRPYASFSDIFGLTSPIWLDTISKKSYHWCYQFLKRFFDIIGALFGILFLLPAFLLISIGIKISSKGPVLFKQKRMGYRGHLFTFLKFRTMKINSEDNIHREYIQKLIEGKNEEINNGSREKPLYKLNNDPRITKVGHFLRKTSLDEIPQFLNVLAGSMSLVGPRPPIPYEVEFYQTWHLQRILASKPGITGLWQVYGRNNTTFNEMVRLDLQYLRKQSIFLDLKIILKTVLVMFNPKAGM